jgi:hypothetical protein
MSTNYRFIIFDDFDWGYVGFSHEKVVKDIVATVSPDVQVSLYGLIIIETYKVDALEQIKKAGIPFDSCLIQRSNGVEGEDRVWFKDV